MKKHVKILQKSFNDLSNILLQSKVSTQRAIKKILMIEIFH